MSAIFLLHRTLDEEFLTCKTFWGKKVSKFLQTDESKVCSLLECDAVIKQVASDALKNHSAFICVCLPCRLKHYNPLKNQVQLAQQHTHSRRHNVS